MTAINSLSKGAERWFAPPWQHDDGTAEEVAVLRRLASVSQALGSAPQTIRLRLARPPSVWPIADAIPIGISLSSASRTSIETGRSLVRTGSGSLTLVN